MQIGDAGHAVPAAELGCGDDLLLRHLLRDHYEARIGVDELVVLVL